MTPFNIAFLFCRLLSIWCVARFVETFGRVVAPFLFTFVSSSSSSSFASRNDGAASIGAASGMGFFACALWLGAPLIARSVTQNIEYSNGVDQPKTTSNWWNIGRGLLGLYILVTGLSGLCSSAIYLVGLQYSAKTLATGFSSSQAMQCLYFTPAVSSLLTTIAGAWLFLVAGRDMKHENDSAHFAPSQDANETGSL